MKNIREHRFKAQRFDGEWVEGYYFAKPILDCYYIICGENQWKIKPETLCEFTGCYDIDKNMIWEHDIIGTYDWFYKEIYDKQEVKYGIWNCGCCYDVFGWSMLNGDVKVLGNIFDNPELLEKNK